VSELCDEGEAATLEFDEVPVADVLVGDGFVFCADAEALDVAALCAWASN
jgi:hypothetical protein